jgi:DNA-binding transcriptional MerR regulator
VFAIGDFSKLARVTVKALRLYDQLGLLTPARVDASSGYRYYSASQLPRLNRILVLKELGFPLDAVARMLATDLSVAELRGMLRLRREEQAQTLQAEQARLENLERRIAELENQRGADSMEILVKSSGPKWLVSVRETITSYAAVGQLFGEVYPALGAKAAGGLAVAIWHDIEYRESDVDAEAGVLLDGPVAVSGRLQCRELPAEETACYVHRGSYRDLTGAYQRLTAWMEERGLQIAGPPREIYLHMTMPVRQDDDSYVTELQFPVRGR